MGVLVNLVVYFVSRPLYRFVLIEASKQCRETSSSHCGITGARHAGGN